MVARWTTANRVRITKTQTGVQTIPVGRQSKGTRRQDVLHGHSLVKKSSLEHHGIELDGVIAEMRKFLLPPLEAIRTSETFTRSWPKNGP